MARLWVGVRILITVVILGFIALAVYRLWPQVRDTFITTPPALLALSLLFALAGMAANVAAWHTVLGQLGHRVPVVESGRIYLVGQLGKYVPGSVWAFVLQAQLALRAGIPRARAFVAALVLTGIATTSALAIGVFGIPALVEVGGRAVWLVAALVPVAIVCAMPPVLSRLVDLALRLLRRPGVETHFTWPGLSRALLWTALAWVLFGAHLAVLASAHTDAPLGVSGFLAVTGAFAIAMAAGLLAFIAPSGIGVREAVLTAGLAPYVGTGTALGVALLSRLLFTIADLIAAGSAALSARRLGQTDALAQDAPVISA